MCCFARKNHRWGLGPIETSNSCAKVAVFHAQNDRFFLGLLKTCYSGPKVAVLHAKTTGGVYSPAETCNSSPKVAVLHPKTTLEGWDPWRLVILMLITLFCMHKTTGEGWNPYVTWFAKIDHFPQKVILIYARSKCNGGAFFERELRIPFISRRNKLRAAAIWRSYVLPCGRYEPKSIDLSSRSA